MMSHCLIELSQRHFDRIRDNAIIVSNIHLNNSIITYDGIVYGKNIQSKRKHRANLTNSTCDLIDIATTKSNYIVIVAKRKQCVSIYPTTQTIPMADLYQPKSSKYTSSGYLVLLIGTSTKSHGKNTCRWNEDDFKLLKKYKKNIIKKGTNHHGSVGHYFSFGNKASFAINNQSSVGVYANRPAFGSNSKIIIDHLANQFEERCANELMTAQDSICRILPLNKIFVMPILTAAHVTMEENCGNSQLNITKCNASGCWASSICVNAQTTDLHTEKDCTYTIITAPKQDKSCGMYEFNFCLNEKNNLSTNMNSGVHLMFSGLFLSHKQYKWCDGSNDLFYNFSSYGNQRLFNHLKQTLKRSELNEK